MDENRTDAPKLNEDDTPQWVKDIQNPQYNPLSPNFDRAAYRDYLLAKHREYIERPPAVTWRIEPYDPTTDIFSPEYDVDADIEEHKRIAERNKEMHEFLNRLAEKVKDATQKVDVVIDMTADEEAPPAQKRARDLAIEQGAIMTLHNRLTSPSTKEFEKALTPAAIKELPGDDGTYTQDETGQISLFPNLDFAETLKLHGAFLSAMLTLALQTDDGKESLLFYAPEICREAGIDPRGYSSKRSKGKTLAQLRYEILYSHIKQFERFVGEINGAYYRVLMLSGYDPRSEVFRVESPYIFQLRAEMARKAPTLKHSQISTLLHASVVNEPNYAAVEVANCIIVRMLQSGGGKKGTTPSVKRRTTTRKKKNGDQLTESVEYQEATPQPEAVYCYHRRYSELIADCPQFRAALDEIAKKPSANKTALYNMKLKRILETAYKIILEESDLPLQFQNLKINGVSKWAADYPPKGRRRAADFSIPTRSKLDQVLYITHTGKNKAYKEMNTP